MRRLFADTFYWIALLSRRDAWHAQVTAFSQALTDADRVWTTDAIFVEVLAAFSLFLDGLSLYRVRPDKEYSLTDCMSMQVMRRERLTDILTNDHHFTQEGFTILFP